MSYNEWKLFSDACKCFADCSSVDVVRDGKAWRISIARKDGTTTQRGDKFASRAAAVAYLQGRVAGEFVARERVARAMTEARKAREAALSSIAALDLETLADALRIGLSRQHLDAGVSERITASLIDVLNLQTEAAKTAICNEHDAESLWPGLIEQESSNSVLAAIECTNQEWAESVMWMRRGCPNARFDVEQKLRDQGYWEPVK